MRSLFILTVVGSLLSTSAISQSTLTSSQLQEIEKACRTLFPDEPKNLRTCIDNRRERLADRDPSLRQQSRDVSGMRKTRWVVVPKSLAELLDEGWRIDGFSPIASEWQSRLFASPAPLNGGAPTGVALPGDYDSLFVLSKSGKFVWCRVAKYDPTDSGTANSWCRALN